MEGSKVLSAVLVVIGAVLLGVGVVEGYLSSLSAPDAFPAWMGVAFIGIILALAGIAMAMGGGNSE